MSKHPARLDCAATQPQGFVFAVLRSCCGMESVIRVQGQKNPVLPYCRNGVGASLRSGHPIVILLTVLALSPLPEAFQTGSG